MTNNISVTWPPALPKLHHVLAWLLFSPARKTLGAKVKRHRLHPFCGETPAPTRVRLALLSPSSCHLRGHFIPDTILSPAHSRGIQSGPTSGKGLLDTNPLCPAVLQGRNAESHPKPRGGTAGVTPQGCLAMASLCQAPPFLPTAEPSCLRKVSGYF